MSAHPRQERVGARLAQHGVTAPDDDAGYVDLEGNHQVWDQDSLPRAVVPTQGNLGLDQGASSWNPRQRRTAVG